MLESLFSGEDERDEVFKLCDIVRETSYSIHKYLGTGTWKVFMRKLWLIGLQS